MATHFKDLYRRYMEKGLPSSDLREFKKELDHIPDEELWNTMINMEKDSAPEIGMPPMMKSRYVRNFIKSSGEDAGINLRNMPLSSLYSSPLPSAYIPYSILQVRNK